MSDDYALAKELARLLAAPRARIRPNPRTVLQYRPAPLAQARSERNAPGRDVSFCFWCSKIRIDKLIYEPLNISLTTDH